MAGVPVLFVGWFCPFAQRTWIAFEFLGISYTLVNSEDSVVLDKDYKFMIKGNKLEEATPEGQTPVVPTVVWPSSQKQKPVVGVC